MVDCISVRETRQLLLFDELDTITKLDAKYWDGSFNGRESSLQQLAPYVGKLKSGMVKSLIALYTKKEDWILDPFSGSGVVPLEAVIHGRKAIGNDLSPYAYTITKGKLEAPGNKGNAIAKAKSILDIVEAEAPNEDISSVPQWVSDFYHPDTLREIMVAFRELKEKEDYFTISCLLGILQHVRPGFLSYPASHLVPYLRKEKYPIEMHPEMYAYRDLRTRLLAKIERAYSHPMIPTNWESREYRVLCENSMKLSIESESIDSIISSPPYFGALDYARDNRLRLWFLGCPEWKKLDETLTANNKVYLGQMSLCIKEMNRVLKPNKYCILVLGDVERDGKKHNTADVLSKIAGEVTDGNLETESIFEDIIPDIRRSRRNTKTTKYERILIMKKQGK